MNYDFRKQVYGLKKLLKVIDELRLNKKDFILYNTELNPSLKLFI